MTSRGKDVHEPVAGAVEGMRSVIDEGHSKTALLLGVLIGVVSFIAFFGLDRALGRTLHTNGRQVIKRNILREPSPTLMANGAFPSLRLIG